MDNLICPVKLLAQMRPECVHVHFGSTSLNVRLYIDADAKAILASNGKPRSVIPAFFDDLKL